MSPVHAGGQKPCTKIFLIVIYGQITPFPSAPPEPTHQGQQLPIADLQGRPDPRGDAIQFGTQISQRVSVARARGNATGSLIPTARTQHRHVEDGRHPDLHRLFVTPDRFAAMGLAREQTARPQETAGFEVDSPADVDRGT